MPKMTNRVLRPFASRFSSARRENVSQKLGQSLIFKIRLQPARRDTFAPKKLPEVLGGSRREFQSPGLERPVVKETVPPGQINQLSDPDLRGRFNSRPARIRKRVRRAFFGRFGLTGGRTHVTPRAIGKSAKEM